ncbi:MAG: Hpt domain-containing protein, partial [Coleofasciculus sp. S288]|nr:Hpt domain-containing protein [Coleofasciculus sp. S288]
MQSEQQQRIMGYFIEEAKDHLNTIEQSLLSLQSTMEDPEMANEVFRAAHSVKGGAAMLGLNSIQQTAHRLEDCFKILKESSVQADQRLESLFLQVFDTLQALVEQLQTPLGLTDEIADSIMLDAEPVFEELNTHLEQLVRSAEGSEMATTDTEEVLVAKDYGAESLAWQPTNVQPFPETKQALPATFKRDVLVCLREMLQLFKQNDLPEHREVLQAHCRNLYSLGEELDLLGWSELLETSRAAIASPQNSYRQLAGLVIKEIKQAQELVLAGREIEVAPSEQLKALVPQEVGTPTAAELNDSAALDSVVSFSNSFNTQDSYIQDNRDTYIQDDTSQELKQPNHRDTETREHEEFISASSTPRITISSETSWRSSPSASSSRREGTATSRPDDLWEPEVGMAELNSLADIFEGQTPDLDQTWQEEEIISLDYGQIPTEPELSLSVDEQNDFSDLIDDLDDLESSAASASASDDVTAWLGNDVQDGLTSYDHQSTESPQSDEFDDILTWSGSEARSQDERFSETTSSRTDDFSDLLFEEESRKPRTSGAMNTEDLNSLFGDSFFEEDSSPEESTVLDLGLEADTVLDVQQQDVDPFAMPPAEAFSNEDSEQLETRTSSFLPDPNFGFGDLLDISESAREAEQSLEISEEFTLESLEAPTSEENLAFTEELGSEDEDIALGFDDLAFDDETVDDFDFAPDNIQRPTDLDLEDFLATEDDLDFSEFQDWEEEGEPDEALAIELEEESVEIGAIDSIPESEVEPEGVENDEPDGILASRDRQEEALADLQASDLDFDLDTTLVSHLNFDEEEADMDDQLANEAEDVQSLALDDSEGFNDFLEQQTAYTESLLGEETAEATDELDLSGLELEELSLEEDSATSEATSLDWDLETEEQITALETAEMFEWEEPQSTETLATDEAFNLESLLGEETAETTDELDLSGLELEELSLEDDAAVSEAASLDWDLETEEQQTPQETQASIFD